jgi:chorismate mutase
MDKNLKEIRSEIDRLDDAISELLRERLSLVISLAGIKDRIEDPQRETEIIHRLHESCATNEEKEYTKAVYERIFESGKKIMKDKKSPGIK